MLLKIFRNLKLNIILQVEGEISDKLQEINLTVIDNEKCKKDWSRISGHSYVVSDHNICTLTKIGVGICVVSIYKIL